VSPYVPQPSPLLSTLFLLFPPLTVSSLGPNCFTNAGGDIGPLLFVQIAIYVRATVEMFKIKQRFGSGLIDFRSADPAPDPYPVPPQGNLDKNVYKFTAEKIDIFLSKIAVYLLVYFQLFK
jgi:hypothetical protein